MAIGDITGLPTAIRENTKAGTVVATLGVEGYDTADLQFDFSMYAMVWYGSVGNVDTFSDLFALEGNQIVAVRDVRYQAYDLNSFHYELEVSAHDKAGNPVGALTGSALNVVDYLDDIRGTARADTLKGDTGMNKLISGAGDDKLYAGRGDDVLYGGAGKDVLSGGWGEDTFLFKSIKESTVKAADVITDWEHNSATRDLINLTAIDADTKISGNQDFDWIGAKKFTGSAGELRYEKEKSHTYVYADVNGDKKADFMIDLHGSHKMYADDFLL
jgi:Ca2+-binding RTX toxin-like protein